MEKQALPLTDEQMREFIINGYITLNTDFPASFHEKIYNHLDDMFEHTGNLGNNVLPLIPEIQEVFDHPIIHGAMQGVLGENYIMHPHRYCHFNPQGGGGQNFHKDSYEGDEQVRHHKCRWTMAFYYPQDVPQERGPTAVLPASQYYETSESAHEQPDTPLCGEAGTVTIVHYDLWHRATANTSDQKRYMLKFLFSRLEEPSEPNWNSENTEWQSVEGKEDSEHPDIHETHWDWYYGKQNEVTNGVSSKEVESLLESLEDDDEKIRLDAVYRLGRVGEDAVSYLKKALYGSSESIRNYAGHALSLTGEPAVSTLIEALQHNDDSIRACAAYALGDMGKSAKEAVSVLIDAANDESPMVRRHVIEGIGIIGKGGCGSKYVEQAVSTLDEALNDEHYWIRYNATRSLGQFGTYAEPAMENLKSQLDDENRYVRFNAAFALKQIDTEESREILYNHLFATRWCALTTRDTPY
ncbi:HEAT repeat domain-containing protein [Candidatus Poribacteria bacterium]|nr:HEAT repeat domain-containing protein [Candidatus Poribacteria bacterium]